MLLSISKIAQLKQIQLFQFNSSNVAGARWRCHLSQQNCSIKTNSIYCNLIQAILQEHHVDAIEHQQNCLIKTNSIYCNLIQAMFQEHDGDAFQRW